MKTNKKRIVLDLNCKSNTVLVAKALASELRLNILESLIEKSLNLSEISNAFSIPLSTAALNIKLLEEAKLITAVQKPGVRGFQKVCGIAFEDIYFNAFQHKNDTNTLRNFHFEIPIGNYFDFNIGGNCGIISEKSFIGIEDSPLGFFSNERFESQLIWFDHGFLEYRFPLTGVKDLKIVEIAFTFEICSEAPGYQNDWPSDVELYINKTKIGSVHSDGDFGDHRGRLNPKWWSDSMTQYGKLRTLMINSYGCFLDHVKFSDENLYSMSIINNTFISFKLSAEKNSGGMNVFGEKFGDYPQAIVMDIKTEN